MDATADRRRELEMNYTEFEKLLPTFAPQENGKFVLMRHGKKVNIFDSAKDALLFAQAQFSDGMYSVQQITTQTVDLGYFSHAMPGAAI
jgi:hypothetical protein